MPDLAAALHSLNEGLFKKLGDLVGLALWAGGTALLALAWSGVKNWLASRRRAKQNDPDYLTPKRAKMDVATDRVCQWAGAEHVALYQFSNGENFSNGDGIKKMSMVSEGRGSNLVRGWIAESQNLPTAAFNSLFETLRTDGRAWLYVDAKKADWQVTHLMETRGYSSVLCCLLRSKQGWLGLLSIAWGPEAHFTDEALDLNLLDKHLRACTAILVEP